MAAARTIVGPPMSICSIASSSVTPLPRDRGLERIEIHHHQLEGEDAVLGQRLHVLGIVVPAEDAAVDLGMERLEPAVHHFGEAGVVGDVADRDALALQVLSGAAGAEDFHAGGGQSAGEIGQPQLVADADQGTLDAGRLHGKFVRRGSWRRGKETPSLEDFAAGRQGPPANRACPPKR